MGVLTNLLAILLFGLPAVGAWLWLIDPRGRIKLERREAAIWVAIGWAAFSAAAIELLSLGVGHNLTAPAEGALNRLGLVIFWIAPAVFGARAIVRRRTLVGRSISQARGAFGPLCNLDRFIVIAIAICAALVAFVAIVAAPNTWDSMTYHLARVAAWLQLGGVAHYATNAEPQLFHPPGAEMLIAQFQAVVGGDRLAASVQFAAYLLTISAASWVAALLGAERRGQLLAALLVATAPMAIMQGSSTQNDLVVTLWLLAVGALTLAARADSQLLIVRGLLACAAVGLAVLTKGTAWIYLPPLLVFLAIVGFQKLGARRAIGVAVLGVVIIGALNLGQWLRNQETYGQPIFTGEGVFDYSNSGIGPSNAISGIVRNAALYIGTPDEELNEIPTDAVRGALEAVGIDPDDRDNTFTGQRFRVAKSGAQEAHGPSFLLFVLTVWALLMTFFVKRFRPPPRLAWGVIVGIQILLFCVLVKWQPWHSRLHLPAAMAAVPLIAVALEQVGRRWLTIAVVAIAAALAPAYLLFNVDRPVIGTDSIVTTDRGAQYFIPRPYLDSPYQRITNEVRERGISTLSMSGNFDDWYYPFNALLGGAFDTNYFYVENPSRRYLDGERPKAVACLNCDEPRRAAMRMAGLVLVLHDDTQELWVQPQR